MDVEDHRSPHLLPQAAVAKAKVGGAGRSEPASEEV
jgi:hypothetical protein